MTNPLEGLADIVDIMQSLPVATKIALFGPIVPPSKQDEKPVVTYHVHFTHHEVGEWR